MNEPPRSRRISRDDRSTSPDAATDSPQSPSRHHNLGDWIARHARTSPTKPAWADADHAYDYAEADQRVSRLTSWLATQGVSRGDRVALWLGNRVALLESLFAVARLGGIAIPVNARLTASEVAYQFDDSESKLALIEPAFRDRARNALERVQKSRPRCVEFDEQLESRLRGCPAVTECAEVSPEDPVILMYTSGTTGNPKGALLPHRKALYNSLNAERYFELDSNDRVLVVAPLFHSLGLQILALPAIHAGASLVIQDGFDAQGVWKTIEANGITYFGGVPTMHQRLLDALDAGQPFREPPACLRFAFTAGAAAGKELIRKFHAHGLQLKQGYGQTETSTLTCLAPEHALEKAGSVGRPVHHAELRLIDPNTIESPVEKWREVGAGEVGEIVVRGPITMLGYWRRPDATAETIREGWLRTGDLATRDADFDITLVGRAREMFISGGENVYPAEVEAVLEEHPQILEAAVVGVPDAEWGEVGRAHVVTHAGASLESLAIGAWLETRLARFKRPKHYVPETELPRTASGKIQKHQLSEVRDSVE